MDGEEGLAHWLKRTTGNAFPVSLVGLEVESREQKEKVQGNVHVEELVRWASAAARRDHKGREREAEAQGVSVSTLWESVDYLLRRHESTWVISHNAARAWALCGLWEMVEKGEVYFVAEASHRGGREAVGPVLRDVLGNAASAGDCPGQSNSSHVPEVHEGGSPAPRNRQDASSRAVRRAGYCAISDQTAVVCARRRGRPGQLVILDIRNYGISGPPEGMTLSGRAGWLLDTVRRMIEILRREGLGSLRHTGGSQALYSWRHSHLTHGVYRHDSPTVEALERAAYYGGRTECYHIGKVDGRVFHVDYRSHYGHICASEEVPCVLLRYGDSGAPLDLFDPPRGIGSIATVTVRTDRPCVPLRRNGITIFPVGEFVTTLCGPELALIRNRSTVYCVHEWAQYEMRPALQSWGRHILGLLQQARAAGDRPICEWLKKLLVCLNGKLGQRDRRWVPYAITRPPYWWGSWHALMEDGSYARARSLAGQCEVEIVKGFTYDSCAAIAAWVCSVGRVRLWEAMLAAGLEEVLYCDTDGMLVTRRGFESLSLLPGFDSGEAGKLRLCAMSAHTCIYGFKHYTFGGKSICAGRPVRATVREDGSGIARVDSGLASVCSRGVRPRSEYRIVKWNPTAVYRHGRVGDNGKVYPFVIGRENDGQ